MARKTFDEIKNHCIICTAEIPTDRLKHGAVTCSKEHAAVRKAQHLALMAQTECKYCRRPSTPEERKAYDRFRRLEAKRPELLYPEAFAAWVASRLPTEPQTAEAFAEHRRQTP